MIKGHLPDEYNRGYQILLDKDNLTQNLPKPNYKEPMAQKPSKSEFLKTVEEFWFEAYHVGIYLKREDLWSVKFRSAAILWRVIGAKLNSMGVDLKTATSAFSI